METFLLLMSSFWESVSGSAWFFVFKVLAVIYTAVLAITIILTMVAHGVLGDFRKQFRGADVPFTKGKVRRTWRSIRNRLSRNTIAQFKVAILEADYFLDEQMGQCGYDGENLTQKLEPFDEGIFSRIETVRQAHKVRNLIVQDENFTITREQTEKILDDYEAFLHDLDML